ncbi:MAG: tetratricopeptide repeat protein, partial [Rhodoferax sp.]|nr:tetratricopeptide repeat protein [Rhodoferax sp.]
AYALMLDAGRKSGSEKVFERAVELGLRARSADAALDAARAWQRAVPTSRAANRYVLQILIGLNRVSDTLEPLRRELAGTAGTERISTIGLLPRYYARVTDKTLAAEQIETALTTDLSSKTTGPAAWSALGMMRLQAGNAAGALQAAQKGAALNPRSDEIAVLALNLLDTQAAQAQPLVDVYLAGKPLPDLQMAYIRKLIASNRLSEARLQLATLTERNPAFAEGWLMKGSLQLQDSLLGEAETSLKRYLQLAGADTAPGDEAKAETERSTVQALLMLAQIADDTNKPAEAEAYLVRINSQQDALRVQIRRALMAARQGKMDQARALIRLTPEAQADDARAKLSAEVQLLRDYQLNAQAYALLEEALPRFSKDAGLLYEQAMLAEKINRPADMERLLRKVIADFPEYHHAYNALGYLLADRNQRLPEARALINKALEYAPNDPFIVDSLAWVEFRSGNLPEARRLLEKAYGLRPDPEIAAHLGEVLWSLGLKDEATDIWRTAQQSDKANTTLQETIRRLRGTL